MDEVTKPVDRVRAAIPIRVRGMSTQNKFFDETAETQWVGKLTLIARIRNLVDLESEVHVTNLNSNLGGTFRVVWLNTLGRDGFHDLGLELTQSEGNLWEIKLPSPETTEPEPAARTWLQCRRCRQVALAPVPEAEPEFFYEGFLIAQACDRCKATTPWEYGVEVTEDEFISEEESGDRASRTRKAKKLGKEHRKKGRAPLSIQIKVIRHTFGVPSEDICKTINVSRHGAYFLSDQPYEVGESVEVVMPYEEGDLTIPLPARVVRRDATKKGTYHAVAIRLEQDKK